MTQRAASETCTVPSLGRPASTPEWPPAYGDRRLYEPTVRWQTQGLLLTLGVGILLIGVYFVLRAFGVVGQPTDIGGGFILPTGYVATAAGVLLVGVDVLRSRSGHR